MQSLKNLNITNMKLLVILIDLDFGGTQNYTLSLINEFIKMGHSVTLSILSEKSHLKDRLSKSVEFKVWARKAKLDFNVLLKIRHEIKNGEYDGIIASYSLYHKLSAIFLRNTPVTIYPIHTTIERNMKNILINFIIFRLKLKNEIFLTSIKSQTKYLCNEYKLKNDFFSQIDNGIDSNRFTFPPKDFNRETFLQNIGIKPEHIIILIVAGFREEKCHIDAFKAFQLLRKEMDNVSLLCVGDNRSIERDILQNYINQNKIPDIKLLIASEAGDVRNYYWGSHLFTLTSNKVETFSISALEAMSSGLPCVLTNIGGAKDFVIPGINGDLCQANKIDDIKDKWSYILNNYSKFDKVKIRNIVVENYSLSRAASEYIHLIEDNK